MRGEDQWWYWTDEWQAGEQQITEDRAAMQRVLWGAQFRLPAVSEMLC